MKLLEVEGVTLLFRSSGRSVNDSDFILKKSDSILSTDKASCLPFTAARFTTRLGGLWIFLTASSVILSL